MDRFADLRNNLTPSPSVCRCLFGPLDRDQNRQFVKDFMAQQTQEINEKYNFDFMTGSPLQGRYKWEKVPENDENVPQAYSLPQLVHQLTKDSSTRKDGDTNRPGTVSDIRKRPASQRSLVFSSGNKTPSQSSPVSDSCSEENVNKEQCNTNDSRMASQPRETTEEQINIQDANTAEYNSHNDLSVVALETDSTSFTRKRQTSIPGKCFIHFLFIVYTHKKIVKITNPEAGSTVYQSSIAVYSLQV